ncbi:pilus assembly protein PilM [Undibacterium sp. RTI2.2]|uniref:pilus assembly protein PilM n=1 Tax=unclassified Undibacterium TaxID=2630295 RepID=UPI002B22EC70|nr:MULTISPECIES: pilus assembly protein PilM [unclassified Undibacterium]MEB0116208.1 pilus assembly protein PilM [Undibacterium sp. RTI2.2]MEB0231732.1 pilus assembly protein PilM [Undibacterium sp. 10I3]MEB0256950.1 pilus assembly protein PilM [Undibacterium sp. 5I1]
MALDLASLLGRKNPPLIGLDISTSDVKLVEISEGSNKAFKLERYGSELLPKGAVVAGNIENIEQVSEAIRRVIKKSGASVKNVALAMPASAVITKKIMLSGNLSEQALELQVETEANQYIPFAMDEVSLDFCVIGSSSSNPEDDIEVMLAASRKEKIEDRVAVAEAAGLQAKVMDIESYAARAAIARLIGQQPNAGQDQIYALFQIGAKVTYISILLNGEVIYERDQQFGGNQLTQDIVRNYGLAFEEAEIKKKQSDLPDSYEMELLEPFLESAALEVTRSIQFFFTSTPYTRVDQIFLAGGCAVIPGLVDMIAERTKISTTVISPFKGMEMSSNVNEKALRSDAPSYLVACGLAMRRFG